MEIIQKEGKISKRYQPLLHVISIIVLCVICGAIISFSQTPNIKNEQIENNQIPSNDQTAQQKQITKSNSTWKVEPQVWILYIGSYANMEFDGHWGSWRFKAHEYESEFHEPPSEIPSCFYPKNGIYSSHDETIIQSHISMIKSTGIDTIVVPWYGKNRADIQHYDNVTGFTDQTLLLLMKHASKADMKVIPMIPLYSGRSANSIIKDLKYYESKYSQEESQYLLHGKPLIMIYDVQNIDSATEIVFTFPNFNFFGSGLAYNDFLSTYEDGFSGFVTFFASEGFTWCSTAANWPVLSKAANQRKMIFVPTVAPGYNDTAIDRWNGRYLKSRECSTYYNSRWEEALKTNSNIVLINSFNDWRGSSNIEPAVDSQNYTLTEKNWCNNEPNYYLTKTKEWIERYKQIAGNHN